MATEREAAAVARRYAGQRVSAHGVRTHRRLEGRLVAFKEINDGEWAVVVESESAAPRDVSKTGGVNVVRDARGGDYCDPDSVVPAGVLANDNAIARAIDRSVRLDDSKFIGAVERLYWAARDVIGAPADVRAALDALGPLLQRRKRGDA